MINRLALRCALLLALTGTALLARAAFAQESPACDGACAVGLARASAGAAPVKRGSPAPVAVLLARVCANESTRVLRPPHDGGTDGVPDPDCHHILETARGWARWQGVSVERAIRALAPHVTGTKPAKSARHAAYASLPARGSDKPAAWDEARFGSWAVHGPRWVKLRAAVAELVRRPSPRRAMVAWGNAEDVAIALRRGLVLVACEGCANSFWRLPDERVLAASVASGGGR